MTGYFRDDGPLHELMLDEAGPARARSALAGVRLHHRRPDAAVLELPLVRAGRDRLPAGRRGVRLRPRRGQGRGLRGQDGAVRRGLPGEGAADRGERPGDPGHRGPVPDHRRDDPPGRAGPAARPSPATSRPSSGSPSGPIAGRSRTDERDGVAAFYRSSASRTGWATRTPSATRSSSILMSPHFCYRVDLPGGDGRHPAALGLRPGQPAELLPLGEHARRGAARPRRGGRPARARGAGGPGPADAPRRPRARAWPRSSAATGSTSAGSRSTTASIAGRFPTFNDELRRSMFEEPIRFFVDLVRERPPGDRVPRRPAHVRQPALARHYGMPDARRRARRTGSGSTTRPDTAAAGCCRWRCS